MYGIIYLITNTVNGKVYVGLTTQKLRDRWYSHCSQSKRGCPLLHNAIKKYGKDNFSIEQIDSAESKSELDKKEQLWISAYDSIGKHGYNISTGGSSFRHSEEHKAKLRELNLGRKLSKESAEKISKAHKGRVIAWSEKIKDCYRHKGPSSKNTTGYKGVSFDSLRRKFKAGTKKKTVGYYSAAEDAAKAYDKYMFAEFGFDCYLNFPEEFRNA